jgi:polyisoprenyl-teichoic acid--peptidoglycan teichoic acid transferase
MVRTPSHTSKPKRRIDGLTLGLMIAFAVLAVITGIIAFNYASSFVQGWSMTNLPGAPVAAKTLDLSKPLVAPNGTPIAGPLQAVSGPTPQPWDGTSRVTILLMGLDYRDWEAGEIPRSDSMILLTVDPLSKTAGMLSIPRDMWVSIPGFDNGKINTAYFLGEAYKVPGGGPGLAVKTVEATLGVPIQFYAQIDFNAFVQFVDEIKGVKLNIKEPILVDVVGPGGKQTLQPGWVTLDGALALAYARNRHTDGNDFDRSNRQQEVILAIRDRILEFNMLPNLIARSPAIYQEISSGIRTNLSLQQVIQLALLGIKIPQENIKKGVIGPNQLISTWTSDHTQQIEIPIPDKIRLLRDEIFATGGPVGPAAVGGGNTNVDTKAMMGQEKARISVQNGAQVAGLASKTADFLKAQGLNVVEQVNADQVYDQTTIFIYTGKPYTLSYLASTFNNVPSSRIFNRFSSGANVDIVLILGKDWAKTNTLPK